MSELKHQLMLNKERSWVPCYLKSEADKVIAEKDMEIFNLKEELSYIKADSAFDSEEKEKEIAKLKAEKNTKNEEIDTLYKKSLSRLKELVNQEYPDKEENHLEADDILCDMLNALGYKDLTEAWGKLEKWYC